MDNRLDWIAICISILSALISGVTCWVTWDIANRGFHAADIDQRRQERAYLAVEDIQVVRYQPGKTWKVVLTIENHGNTPALTVKTQFATGVLDYPLNQSTDRYLQELPGRAGQTTITGKMVKAVVGTAISWNDARSIASGKKALFFFGRVRYRDVFGEEHVSNFCITARALIAGELTQGICRSGNTAT